MEPSTDPSFICQMSSGCVYLSQMQFLRGYCILSSEPVVASINDLLPDERSFFLLDMVKIGDAIMKVTDAFRINYAIMGNNQPVLHAHIVPRHMWEPEKLRKGLPWDHPEIFAEATQFDPKRDQTLVDELRNILQT
jgi:diadenosine tetraphosphate (Ap4A) HIT family hydrolase